MFSEWWLTLPVSGCGGTSAEQVAQMATALLTATINTNRLAFFFFFISIFAHYSAIGPGRMVFSMTWYSFIFPNTALITATFAIGAAFNCAPIEIIGTAMVIPLIAMYLFVFGMMIRAIVTKQILWPQKGEDKDEGGFEINQIKRELPGEGSPV